MPEIRYPEGPGAPPVPSPPAAPAGPRPPADDAPETEPAPSPWQAAVIRVSVVVAVWLGY